MFLLNLQQKDKKYIVKTIIREKNGSLWLVLVKYVLEKKNAKQRKLKNTTNLNR